MFFDLFAAAEPYISVTITHGTPCIDPWVQRHRRSGIVMVCRESGVKRWRTCGSLGQNPQTLTTKQQAKDMF